MNEIIPKSVAGEEIAFRFFLDEQIPKGCELKIEEIVICSIALVVPLNERYFNDDLLKII